MNETELKPLTKRQQEIFDFILDRMTTNGAPPTRVEIAEHFGFKSPNAAEDHLKALDKKGHIQLISGTSRGIYIAEAARANAQMDPEFGRAEGLAVVGDVAAGAPIFASEHIQQYVNVDQALFSENADYLLKVKGDSMINAGIFEQDLLAIKKTSSAKDNEIVVARIEDDVTVKRFQRHGSKVSLIAENDEYAPIDVDLQTQVFTIEGKVVGLIRRWP